MRKHYHLRRSARDALAWDVDRLIGRSCRIPPIDAPLTEIRGLDDPFWFDHDGEPISRQAAVHAKLILEADLDPPIVVSNFGRVMDGIHRVCRALIEGRSSVRAASTSILTRTA